MVTSKACKNMHFIVVTCQSSTSTEALTQRFLTKTLFRGQMQ